MPKPVTAALALLLCLLAGCSGPDTHESLGVKSIEVMEDFAEVLAEVKDVESAKAAAPRLEKIAERMEDLRARREALGEPTDAEQEAFREKYKDRLDQVGEAFFEEIGRIMALDPAVNAELERIMDDLQGRMQL